MWLSSWPLVTPGPHEQHAPSSFHLLGHASDHLQQRLIYFILKFQGDRVGTRVLLLYDHGAEFCSPPSSFSFAHGLQEGGCLHGPEALRCQSPLRSLLGAPLYYYHLQVSRVQLASKCELSWRAPFISNQSTSSIYSQSCPLVWFFTQFSEGHIERGVYSRPLISQQVSKPQTQQAQVATQMLGFASLTLLKIPLI